MAILVSDLLTTNGGAIPPFLFPDKSAEEIEQKLDAYLTAGYALAGDQGVVDPDTDGIARAWAYHAAFDEVFLEMNRGPASASFDGEESFSFTASQIAAFGERAAYWLAKFDELVAVAIGEDEPDQGWATVTSLRH